MKKIITLIAAMVMGVTLSHPVMGEEMITIVGTGSGMAVLDAVGEAFTLNNPGIGITVPDSIGSGGGIKAVGRDRSKIGRIAREIKAKEKHYGLTYVPFAKMPIVFFVTKSIRIRGLTTKQVRDIYSGKITNWKDVGGKDARIRVVRREPGDSSLKVLLASFPGFADITLTSKSKTTFSDPKTCQFVESKVDTIAFGTYINARNYNVNILSIGGKYATDTDWPYVGTLALIYKEMNNRGNIKKFVEFASSAGAHDAIKGAGGMPL